MYKVDYIKYEPMPPSQTHHIIWNVLLADKQMELTEKTLEDDNICHIIAILPQESDFLELNTSIKNFPYTVLEYGKNHDTTIDKTKFAKCGSFVKDVATSDGWGFAPVDSVARTQGRRNILIFCNNGYQRSIPFLVYYLTTFHKDEIPTMEKALTIILSQTDKLNYNKVLQPMVENVSKLLQ
jgi:hypothetical protein